MAETLSSYEIKEKQKPLVIEGKPRDYKRSQEDSKQRLEIELREKQAELEQAEGELKELQAAKQSKTAVEEYQEKEKILKYGKIADLSYINFKTSGLLRKNIEIESVALDDAMYPRMDKIVKGEKLENLTAEEIKLVNFMNDPNNIKNTDDFKNIPKEYNQILAKAGLPYNTNQSVQLAYNADGGIIPQGIYDLESRRKAVLVSKYFEQEKVLENAIKNFEELKQDFKILDYYPNETNKDNGSSGLGAVFLERDGKKYLAIRGTEFNSWADLLADAQMIMGSIPDRQVKDLIKFVDRNIKPGESISIIGHSLGGALSQIASAMYLDKLRETYTFNSPGAKNLKASQEDRKEFGKIDTFMYNKDKPELQKKVVNVMGVAGVSPVANLGEDIGDHEIRLENLYDHRITVLLEYVQKLREDSEELKRKLKTKKDKKDTENIDLRSQ